MAKSQKSQRKRIAVPLLKEHQLETEKLIAKHKEDEPEAFDLPASKRTIQELSDYFTKIEEGLNRILPKEKRRYVLYLRKSTDDEAKQVRSLEDQRSECIKMIKDQKIIIREEDIFEESASAKRSGNRPVFDKILLGFETGKYHGLIAWSPDRLSRNMKEAGEIIEMIDLEKIQDLQFKTYQFENNPNGKMLLGILFATSKQYSDKLSVDVSRGITGNIQDGKYNGVIKKGYYVDKSTGYFIPDGYNWDLLREAVNMRLYKNKTNGEVAEYLNNAHLSIRKNQDEPYKKIKVDNQMVGDIFKDTFYFGLYRFNQNLADLTELYNFLPLITPDEYISLNQKTAADYDEKYAGKAVQNKRLDYGLLRGKVICDFCDKPMQFQHQPIHKRKNKGRWVISFYCRNKDCQRHKTAENIAKGITLSRSIRAKFVMAAIEYTLRSCTKKSNDAYKLHIAGLEAKLAQDRAITNRKLNEAKSEVSENKRQYMRYQNFQMNLLSGLKAGVSDLSWHT